MLSIQRLAGHESLETGDLETNQRYMHLSSDAPRAAIQALEEGGGDVGETGVAVAEECSNKA